MQFELPESAEQFRTELNQFLDDELPDWWTHLFNVDERTPGFMVELCRKLADKQWLTMAWPKEFGGQEADIWMRMVLNEEMRFRGEPRGSHYMCVNYIGPLIMQVGTPEQQERFLKPWHRAMHFGVRASRNLVRVPIYRRCKPKRSITASALL